jgi:hypothetical protein
MTENPTCQGCALNYNFFENCHLPHIPIATMYAIPDLSSYQLTESEKEVLAYLAHAWNKFIKLDNHHLDHINEFRHGIHKLQYIIGVRVAQRLNPEIWWEHTAPENSGE